MAELRPSIAKLSREDVSTVAGLLRASGVELDLEAELSREIALPWVLKGADSGEPLAFSLVWSVADELQLIDIASHPQHRRQGHARALLNELLSYARREHKRLILLEVRQSNQAAIRLYESVGFTTSGVRRRYYSDTGEDALLMRITFDPDTGLILPEQNA
ncbi:MAG TPA: ribosomal protein S18-alanine N-acetyltransferase [Polyangiaceae bacterium]|nr:ribosomal protein S18-alanine N-acetyltransferase [Polyangiaceae bacterium]